MINRRCTISDKIWMTIVVFIIIFIIVWAIFFYHESKTPNLSIIKDVVGILSTIFASTVAVLLFQDWRKQETYKEIKDIKKIIVHNNSIIIEKKQLIDNFLKDLNETNILVLPPFDKFGLITLINFEKETRVAVESSDFFKCNIFKNEYTKFFQEVVNYNQKVRWAYTIYYNYFNDKELVQDLGIGQIGVQLEHIDPITFDVGWLEKLPNLKNINTETFCKLKEIMEEKQEEIKKSYEQYSRVYENYLKYLNSLQ